MKRAVKAKASSPEQAQSHPDVMRALPDVLFIDDLARLFRISRRTLEKLRRHKTFPIPTIPTLDKRARWSRVEVERFLAGGPGRDSRPVKSAANAR